MPRVRETCRLHPETVSNATSHTRLKTRKARTTLKLTYLKVDPEVWSKAKRLAGNDPRRIDIISPTTVIVRNYPVR